AMPARRRPRRAQRRSSHRARPPCRRGRLVSPRILARHQGYRPRRRLRARRAPRLPGGPSMSLSSNTRFGEFGGVFAPETLMAPLEELERSFLALRDDPSFTAELAALHRDYAGRPTPLTPARRLSQ